jgi:hypothetical protein
MIRLLRTGAALLLMGAAAACSDAPTAARVSADGQSPALYTAPTVTVSNSGGYPLVGWGALTGATGYSVALVITETQTNRQTAESTSWTDEYPVGGTTGTSVLDAGNPYTGVSLCTWSNYPIVTRVSYRYRVTATFSGGTSASSVAAPVAQC